MHQYPPLIQQPTLLFQSQMLKMKNIFVIAIYSFNSLSNYFLPFGPAGPIKRSRNELRWAIRSERVIVSRPSRENWRNTWFLSGTFCMPFRASDIESIGVEDITKRDSIFIYVKNNKWRMKWCNSCTILEIGGKTIFSREFYSRLFVAFMSIELSFNFGRFPIIIFLISFLRNGKICVFVSVA